MPEKKKVKLEEVNPQVKDMKIGVRHLRKIKVYPLSVADQLELTDMITEAVGVFFSLEAEKLKEGPPMEFVVFMFNLIKENIGEIVTKITGEEDSDAILRDMTNDQMTEMVSIVYKENYEGPFGRLVDLFQGEDEETKVESILAKLRSPSAESTEPTDSTTSSEKAIGKEA